MGESLQQERESPWALTLTKRVPEAFEIPPSDWPEKYFSGQSEDRISNTSGTRSVRVSAQGLSRSCCNSFAHENPVVPTSCPWVSEDGDKLDEWIALAV